MLCGGFVCCIGYMLEYCQEYSKVSNRNSKVQGICFLLFLFSHDRGFFLLEGSRGHSLVVGLIIVVFNGLKPTHQTFHLLSVWLPVTKTPYSNKAPAISAIALLHSSVFALIYLKYSDVSASPANNFNKLKVSTSVQLWVTTLFFYYLWLIRLRDDVLRNE